ncbi:Protoporphyrinogen IX dehydrogenase [menaquinone] [Vibrio stylophorae]|uniref:Protoporphyrinogen IX dehydrogenase [quinone] n=1 Tax=Vibrio stylophorae TaxID=659351 RepID=A0ABM8ZWM0_9VIBR|nr:menaquinone-dependent protoporphyrinogen IX dehydrogenase [Vibrio stylophorae]CAH0534741.1 Protoporphyrinogen IX dehydrogenase [menaquinone] [Vibrio stylophorae]
MSERNLLLYSSTDGHTVKIMHYIEETLAEPCEIMNVHERGAMDFSGYKRVIIGASIRYGHLSKAFYQFVAQNQTALAQANAAFFCVNLTARKANRNTPETSPYVRTFLKRSPWQPAYMGVFAGALDYPSYRWFDRMMIQLIMKITGGETDTSKSLVYTDWQKVAEFARSCPLNIQK